MQVKMPVDFRQSFKWVGNLDAMSMIFVGGGGLIAVHTFIGSSLPLAEKFLIAVPSVGFGALFGLGRWPIEYGDNLVTWAQRFMAYRSRGHIYRGFRVLTVREAAQDVRRYEERGL